MAKMNIIQGFLTGKDLRFGIIVSRFNEFLSGKLLDGAMDCLVRHEVEIEDISVAWVPGAFEIPLIAQKMAASKKYDALICLGTIIRGATPHFDYVAAEVSKGVAATSLKYDLPVIFGILTTENIEQAIERAGTKSGNKGFDAAAAALEMANLCRGL